MQSIENQKLNISNKKKFGQNQTNKYQQGIIQLGLARLSKGFQNDFLNQKHAGPYQKQQFLKSLNTKGIVMRIIPNDILDQKLIQNFVSLIVFRCTMKDFHQFFITFLQNLKIWNLQNLTFVVGLDLRSKPQEINKVKSDLLFKRFNQILNRTIPKIIFPNLQQLVLRNLDINNIQFLTLIMAPYLRNVYLSQNHIVSTKSLAKLKRTNLSFKQSQYNFIELIGNPIKQHYVNRISLLRQQTLYQMVDIDKKDDYYTYQTDLRFIMKLQIDLLRKVSKTDNRTKWTLISQSINQQNIKVNQKFNKLLKNN